MNYYSIPLKLSILFFTGIYLCTLPLSGQVSFTQDFEFSDQTGRFFNNPNFKSGLVMAVADLDNDQLDDLVRFSNGRSLEVQLQDNGWPFRKHYTTTPTQDIQFTVCVADVDRNGWNDILLGEDDEGVKLLQFDSLGQNPVVTNLAEGVFFVQGSNFSDINGDGWIDAFVCNDLGPSKIWMNNGSGTLIPDDAIIDLQISTPVEMNAGNYSSIWIDFDNDNDQDLYISKCFSTAFSTTDPRRVNQLYVNDGQNRFSEMADSFGLADGLQSWTSDFQDIDNDGDLDCFVVNHYSECKLYENDGTGRFTDITFQSGLDITRNHLQLAMKDFDNDGWIDLLVAGQEAYEFYYNLGNKRFQKVNNLFGGYSMGTFAIGDLNNDGFCDIYSASTENSEKDILWINLREGQNNYLSVSLEGRISNPNAIGSRIELYGAWGVQLREIRSGESYGIMNSMSQSFGFGRTAQADSMIVRWRSGRVDKYMNIPANQHLHLVEGECIYPGKHIRAKGPVKFCSGETVELEAPAGTSYQWSTGETVRKIRVSTSGFYSVSVTNQYNCSTVSEELEVVVDPDETPGIQIDGDTIFCAGSGIARLLATPADNYLWSTGHTGNSLLVNYSGQFTVSTVGLCDTFTSEAVNIHALSPKVGNARGDTLPGPGIATLSASGNDLYWYDAENELIGNGPVVEVPITETSSFFVEDVVEMAGTRCVSMRTEVIVYLDSLTSLTPIANAGIKIYPNPVNEYLFVDLEDAKKTVLWLELFDHTGRSLARYPAGAEQLELAMGDYPQGIYYLLLQLSDEVLTHKLIRVSPDAR